MKFTSATAALMAAAGDATAAAGTPLFRDKLGNARKLTEIVLFESNPGLSKEEHSMEMAKTLLKNRKKKDTKKRGQTLQNMLQTAKRQQLVSLYLENPEMMEECDVVTADSGILSCGQGRYCVESETLFQGRDEGLDMPVGLCVDSDLAMGMMDPQQWQSQRRSLQGDVDIDPPSFTNSSIIQDMYDICYASNITDAEGVTCDCQGIDVQAYSGTLSCTYQEICGDLPSICRDNVTFCYTTSYQLSVSAPYTGGFSTTYSFNSPYTFQYSYGIFYNGSSEPDTCELGFDGVTCNSCAFSQVTDSEGSPTECLTFDCTNTELGLEATFCDYTILDLTIADYLLYSRLPCDNACYLCGQGNYVTNKEANLTFPTGEMYACGLVEISALAGIFYNAQPDLCTVLPPLIDDFCGCSGDANFTFAPTDVPVPTEAPAPTDVPDIPTGSGEDLPAATPEPTVSAAGANMVGASAVAAALVASWWAVM
jgi:hypothetical protein